MSLEPGTNFAGYVVERLLGVGGMGSVYLATHPRLPRREALKLLRRELCADPVFVERFLREAAMVSRLSHPHILPVNDRGSEDGQLWMSMPYVEGQDAEAAVNASPNGMAAERAVRIVGQVGLALDYAHRQQLLHRDVKPANILLTAGAAQDGPEWAFLTDFGIAKAVDERVALTATGSVLATFAYASPEQIEAKHLDHRSDIYSLGGVLYTLLTGSVPYPGPSIAVALNGHLHLPPPRPTALARGLPTGLDEVVATAMAKAPEDRYQTCQDLVAAAERALAVAPVAAPVTEMDVTRSEHAAEETSIELPDGSSSVHASGTGVGEPTEISHRQDPPIPVIHGGGTRPRSSRRNAILAAAIIVAVVVAAGVVALIRAQLQDSAGGGRPGTAPVTSEVTSAGGGPGSDTSSPVGETATAAAAGASTDDPVTVAFVPKLQGVPYFEAMNAGGQAAAEELGYMEWLYQGPAEADAAAQAEVVQSFIEQKVDTLIVSPVDPDAMAPLLAQAQAAGIHVATADTDAPLSVREAFINQASVQAIGEGLTDAVVGAMGGKGKYAIVSCGQSAANLNAWIEVQKAYTASAYPEAEIVDIVYAGNDQAQATEMATDLMNAHPDLTGLVGECTSSAPGVAQAVRDAGKIGQVFTVGLGTPQSMKPYLADGSSSASILWDVEALGYLSAWTGAQLAAGIPFKATNTVSPSLPAVAYDESTQTLLLGPALATTKDTVDQFSY